MGRRGCIESVRARVAAIDATVLTGSLDEHGYAVLPALLDSGVCRALAALYAEEQVFRSRIVMERHGFGRGEYKYLRYPLPDVVAELRRALYPLLVPLANRWRGEMREDGRFPATLKDFLAECHAGGQTRPTPLILKYAAGDYNCLHQDLYGSLAFPFQLTVLLSDPAGFAGGEFLLVEQRPRMQSKAEVVPLRRGDAVVFAVHHRPVRGTRGFYRVNQRHGVSRVRRGERMTLGIIFHDAA